MTDAGGTLRAGRLGRRPRAARAGAAASRPGPVVLLRRGLRREQPARPPARGHALGPPAQRVLAAAALPGAWAWGGVFGLGEAGVRSLSLIAGAATVPVAYLAGRELSGVRAGLVAAALVAVSPFLVFYSQEARAYALLTLLGALSFWLFARALRRPDGWSLGAVGGRCRAGAGHPLLRRVPRAGRGGLAAGGRAPLPSGARGRRRRGARCGRAAAAGAAAGRRPHGLDRRDRRDHARAADRDPVRGGRDRPDLQRRAGPGAGGAGPSASPSCCTAASARRCTPRACPSGSAPRRWPCPWCSTCSGAHYLIARNAIAALPGAAGGRRRPAGRRARSPRGALRGGRLRPRGGDLGGRLVRPEPAALGRPVGRGVAATLGGGGRGRSLPQQRPADGLCAGLQRVAPGIATTRIDVIEPLRRRGTPGPDRAPTPAPPPGFVLVGREDGEGYSRVRYRSATPRPLTQAEILRLSPPQPPWDPVVLARRP